MALRRSIVLAGLAFGVSGALVGCAGVPGGAPLVSAQYPPGTGAVNSQSEPQPLNSLPPGAANVSAAPGGYQPNFFAWTFGAI